MTLKHKRLLYLFFFGLFLLITPLLIMYTAGYRYNFKAKNWQKTGLLLVETQPENVEIFLENRLVGQKTPLRLSQLLPGEYFLAIQKDGYYPWQQHLKIAPQQTTFIKGVTLVRRALPSLLLAGRPDTFWPSSEGSWLFYFQTEQASSTGQILDLNQATSQVVTQLLPGVTVSGVQLAPSQKRVIFQQKIQQKTSFWLYDLNRLSPPLNLTTWLGEIKLLRWHPSDDNLIYFVNAQGLWQADRFAKKIKLLDGTTGLADFWLTDQQKIITFKIRQKTLFLYQDRLTGWQQTAEINANFRPWGSWQQKLIFFNPLDQQVLLVDLFDTQRRERLSVSEVFWWDSQTLLLYNDWEIYFYNLEEGRSNLLTRYSQKISALRYLPSRQQLVFIAGDAIQFFELNDAEGLNSQELLRAQNLQKLALDASGKYLYFVGKIGQQEGLYQLVLFD